MAVRKRIDFVLGGTIFALSLFGVLILAGVSAPFGLKNFGSPGAYFSHQLLYGVLPGVFLCLVFALVPLEKLRKWSLFLFLSVSFAMVLVFFPFFGITLGGASRWLTLGPISFQPSEFLKLAFILYFAALLAGKSGNGSSAEGNFRARIRPQRFYFFLLASGILITLLILQPDISTLGILIAVGFIMYFVAKTPLWHSFAFPAFAALAFLILVLVAPYRMHRLLVFLNPSTDPMGIGYQSKQALIAVGSGGIFGRGLGMGVEHVRLLPAAMTDAVFAAIAMEMGFIGSALLILLFFLFVWRGFRIAKRTHNEFLRLSAIGITSWIGLQAFTNMGAMVGLLPLSGIPLPFISYGGSHAIAEFVAAGVLLNISRHSG